VRDDGSGIPDGFRRGVGVTTMSERAAELGGLLTVSRVEPHGTVVEAELPLAGRQGTILAGSHGNDLAGQP
jgi:signal transduction histidine kinase